MPRAASSNLPWFEESQDPPWEDDESVFPRTEGLWRSSDS